MKKIKKLAIFDFDGTLVDTPLPDIGRLTYQEKTGKAWPHEGWWGRELSLDTDIFEMPVVPQVIEDYEKEKLEDSTALIMLTGRMTKLRDSVLKILDSHNLQFHEYHYNRGGATEVAKIKTMEQLLEKYLHVEEIAMWDDREAHIAIFQKWGDEQIKQGNIKSFQITHIPADRHK